MGETDKAGPPQETLSSFAILSCWELWGAASRWRTTHSGCQTPPTWGPGVTPHHVTAPCDVIIGRHIMAFFLLPV